MLETFKDPGMDQWHRKYGYAMHCSQSLFIYNLSLALGTEIWVLVNLPVE